MDRPQVGAEKREGRPVRSSAEASRGVGLPGFYPAVAPPRFTRAGEPLSVQTLQEAGTLEALYRSWLHMLCHFRFFRTNEFLLDRKAPMLRVWAIRSLTRQNNHDERRSTTQT